MGLSQEEQRNLPKIVLISSHIPLATLPQIYKACDVFVLPSRGEGWGRPHVEGFYYHFIYLFFFLFIVEFLFFNFFKFFYFHSSDLFFLLFFLAMSMAKPIITTGWSGPTEYLTNNNSYILEIDGLSEIQTGAFRTHLWANPSVTHLQKLMRFTFNNPDDAIGFFFFFFSSSY